MHIMVLAFIAVSGEIFIFIQAKEFTKFILPLGEEPGFKSLAKANGIFSLISFLQVHKEFQ